MGHLYLKIIPLNKFQEAYYTGHVCVLIEWMVNFLMVGVLFLEFYGFLPQEVHANGY